jgi:hypothetical protein
MVIISLTTGGSSDAMITTLLLFSVREWLILFIESLPKADLG